VVTFSSFLKIIALPINNNDIIIVFSALNRNEKLLKSVGKKGEEVLV
jgi:hypothetical protein